MPTSVVSCDRPVIVRAVCLKCMIDRRFRCANGLSPNASFDKSVNDTVVFIYFPVCLFSLLASQPLNSMCVFV